MTKREKRVGVTPTQRKILENANGRTPPNRPLNRSESGGWSGSAVACWRRGWLDRQGNITDDGRAALKEGKE